MKYNLDSDKVKQASDEWLQKKGREGVGYF